MKKIVLFLGILMLVVGVQATQYDIYLNSPIVVSYNNGTQAINSVYSSNTAAYAAYCDANWPTGLAYKLNYKSAAWWDYNLPKDGNGVAYIHGWWINGTWHENTITSSQLHITWDTTHSNSTITGYDETVQCANGGNNRVYHFQEKVRLDYIYNTTGNSPTADFTITNQTGNIPFFTRCTDNSTGTYVNSNWTYHDGSTTDNVSSISEYIYTVGNYTIKHCVQNDLGLSSCAQKTVSTTISSGLTADFSYTPDLPTVNQSVTFTNLATNYTSYIWTFEDVNQSNPVVYQDGIYPDTTHVIIYGTSGYKKVILDVASGELSAQKIKYVMVGSVNNTLSCVGFNCTGNATLELIQTIPTALPTLPNELNKTYYRDQINSTILGNFSASYLSVVDTAFIGSKQFVNNTLNIFFLPVGQLSGIALTLSSLFVTLTGSFMDLSAVILNTAVLLTNALHWKIIALLTVRLLYSIILIILEGVFD